MLGRLTIGFSHLCEHKFRHNFKDTLDPLCSSSTEAETKTHYFPRAISTMKTEPPLSMTWKIF